MSRSHVLYALQQTDLELEAVVRRLAEIAAQLGESAELQQARQRVTGAEDHLHKCHGQTKDLDLEVRGVVQRIQTDEQRLYGGRVTNPKELASLQNDTASLKRWRGKKEEEQLEAMFAEEAAEASLSEARAALARTTDAWQTGQSDMLAEQSRLREEQQGLQARRALLIESAGASDVAIYDHLRPRKGGRAVAVVKSGLCQACRMTPPSSHLQQASVGAELVYCNNCGRIMHLM